MTFLPWQNAFEINVPAFDAEHRHLVSLVNALHEAQTKGNGQNECAELLKKIVEHAKLHFAHEEQLMTESAYPRLERHRAQHAGLISSVANTCSWVDTGAIDTNHSAVSAALLNFLKKCLLDHIVTHDMDMGAFLQDRVKEGLINLNKY